MKTSITILFLLFYFGIFSQELQSTSREIKLEAESKIPEQNNLESVEGQTSRIPKEKRTKKSEQKDLKKQESTEPHNSRKKGSN